MVLINGRRRRIGTSSVLTTGQGCHCRTGVANWHVPLLRIVTRRLIVVHGYRDLQQYKTKGNRFVSCQVNGSPRTVPGAITVPEVNMCTRLQEYETTGNAISVQLTC
eukprot:GHVS01068759.1.p1 GENE.GHVS01068759.1~~GHVS01068759.1.p1  ORF type:complete len:107 (-),score=1.11 GHVS01068759.1:352-672(-)